MWGNPETHIKRINTGICSSSFSWMISELGQDPCTVAAYLSNPCVGGDINVQPLAQGSSYPSPTDDNANICDCSWAEYNTVQACALCQSTGGVGSIIGWTRYRTNCTGGSHGNLSSRPNYYPLVRAIPAKTTIPYWATENPNNWPNGKFNGTTAEALAVQGIPDSTQQNRSSSSNTVEKKSNTKIIIAAVVGGVFFIVVLGLLAFLWRKKRLRLQKRSRIYRNGEILSDEIVHDKQQGRQNYQNLNLIDSPRAMHPSSFAHPHAMSTVNTSTNAHEPETIEGAVTPFIIPDWSNGLEEGEKPQHDNSRIGVSSRESQSPPSYFELSHFEASAEPIRLSAGGQSSRSTHQDSSNMNNIYVVQNDTQIDDLHTPSREERDEHGYLKDVKQ